MYAVVNDVTFAYCDFVLLAYKERGPRQSPKLLFITCDRAPNIFEPSPSPTASRSWVPISNMPAEIRRRM